MSTGLTAHGSEFAKFEYSSDNQVWNEIPGISGYTESGGEAPERDVVAFSGVAKRSGHPRVPSIELQAVYQPAPRGMAGDAQGLDRGRGLAIPHDHQGGVALRDRQDGTHGGDRRDRRGDAGRGP